MMPATLVTNIDEYISCFPENVQKKLQQLRVIILKSAPNSVEVISYKMPAFKQNGVLVYFAAYKNHIGFYPTASGIRVFKNDISEFKNSKGAVQFPIDKPLPHALISKMVKFRVMEDLKKEQAK